MATYQDYPEYCSKTPFPDLTQVPLKQNMTFNGPTHDGAFTCPHENICAMMATVLFQELCLVLRPRLSEFFLQECSSFFSLQLL